MTNHDVERFSLQQLSQPSTRPQDGQRAARVHSAQYVHRHAGAPKLGARTSFEGQGKMGLHPGTLGALARKCEQHALNAAKHVAARDVKHSHWWNQDRGVES
jgi:hypothetical protein